MAYELVKTETVIFELKSREMVGLVVESWMETGKETSSEGCVDFREMLP